MKTQADGEIDYRAFSLDELNEVRRTINRSLYPKNYENLLIAIAEQEQAEATSREEIAQATPQFGCRRETLDERPSLSVIELVEYAAIFFVAYVASVILVAVFLADAFFQEGRLYRIVFYAAGALAVGVRFIAKHRRLFYKSEFVDVVGASFGLLALLDFVGVLLAWLFTDTFDEVRFHWLATILLIALGLVLYLIDYVLIYLTYRFPARWLMLLCLRRI